MPSTSIWRKLILAAAAGVMSAGIAAAAPIVLSSGDELQVVSGEVSPRVGFTMSRDGGALQVVVAAADGAGKPQVTLGVAAGKSLVVKTDAADARVAASSAGGQTRYTFTIPAAQLVGAESDWEKLRLAFAVRWPGAAGAVDVERERFRCIDGRAPHADLSDDPATWAPISLAELQAAADERRLAMVIHVDQPMDGKLTVVIDDAAGRRVRNLVSGQAVQRGPQTLVWDGLSDDGRVMPPGEYRWRAASHPGVIPEYRMSFYNHGNPPWRDGSGGSGWLSDHTDPVTATSVGDRVYLGTVLAEAGNMIIQVKPDGTKVSDANKPSNIGWGTSFLAADENCLYVLNEGYSGYADTLKDLGDGKWKCLRPLTLIKYDHTGKLLSYGKKTEVTLAENPYEGEDKRKGERRNPPAPHNLGGAALVGGKLYVSLKQENRIVILSPESGEVTGEIKLDQPGLLAADKNSLVGFSGDGLVRIDTATQKITPLFAPSLSQPMQYPPHGPVRATGLVVSGRGEIFVCDNGVDQNIKVFDASGKLLRSIGKPGGRPLNGAWDTAGMYQPHGVTIDSTGQLWVTETDASPRRISVWDAATGAFKTEYLGPGRYGSPGGSFDPADGSRWIGGGALWKLDLQKLTATCVADLYHPTKPGQMDGELPNNSYHWARRDGRTFIIGQGRYTSVYELRADNTLKEWAFVGSLSTIAQNPRWTLPKGLADAPALKSLVEGDENYGKPAGQFNDRVTVNEQKLRSYGTVLWVDRNGDDIVQADETEVSSPTQSLIGMGWGSSNASLDMKFPARIDTATAVVTLKCSGFLPSGAPDYKLADALAAAKPLSDLPANSTLAKGEVHSSAQDRFGRLLLNTSPMTAIGEDGKPLWTYPNRWIDVHGSHDAPLPETGVMQGALWFLGTAPLDKEGEVTVINGNHGRFFVMTTDGLYLDEMFKDVRVTQHRDAYAIGGEPFGGFFGRDEKTGAYYLQSGHTDYRIFRINGLADLKRSGGTMKVSAEQVAAAQRKAQRALAAQQPSRAMNVASAAADVQLGNDPEKWPGGWSVQWGDPKRPFPFAQVKAVRQGDHLHLAWRVRDPSPWVNNGSDWTMLFKTGDSVNFEFATDPSARTTRSGPVAGDRRLLIGPMGKENVAVLYDYRASGEQKKPVSFSSPWRTEAVDRVQRLADAKISVKKESGGYTLLADLPLAELGLPGAAATLQGDFGVIYGDEAGSIDLLRSYWSNQSTALVSDVPGEVQINPSLWGTLRFPAEEPR